MSDTQKRDREIIHEAKEFVQEYYEFFNFSGYGQDEDMANAIASLLTTFEEKGYQRGLQKAAENLCYLCKGEDGWKKTPYKLIEGDLWSLPGTWKHQAEKANLVDQVCMAKSIHNLLEAANV